MFDIADKEGQKLLTTEVVVEVRQLLLALDVESSCTAQEHSEALSSIVSAVEDGTYVGLFASFISVANFGSLKSLLELLYGEKEKATSTKSLESPIMSVLKVLHEEPASLTPKNLEQFTKNMHVFLKVGAGKVKCSLCSLTIAHALRRFGWLLGVSGVESVVVTCDALHIGQSPSPHVHVTPCIGKGPCSDPYPKRWQLHVCVTICPGCGRRPDRLGREVLEADLLVGQGVCAGRVGEFGQHGGSDVAGVLGLRSQCHRVVQPGRCIVVPFPLSHRGQHLAEPARSGSQGSHR